ncbi:hypothetical protein [Flavobacterium sp.]|uniref:hypothetical protein n=1 Tax=Flavobacterium sp. TaxID=239 RepID=UPI00286A509A|nr:hypothetical protein [Flavobacterium sp.]
MIEVFKTNVQFQKDAELIVSNLEMKLLNSKINFDLEDCDKILRIEGANKSKSKYVLSFMQQIGYNCQVLE